MFTRIAQKSAEFGQKEMEERAKEIENIQKQIEQWRTLSHVYEERISKVSHDMLIIKDIALASVRNVQRAAAERDEAVYLLTREKERKEVIENDRNAELSSLQHEKDHEKACLGDEVKKLRETLRSRDEEIAELEALSKKYTQEKERKDRQIARLESSEEMVSFSRAISGILSEMSEVVPFVQKDGQNITEKMRALRDGIEALVSEIQGSSSPPAEGEICTE